VVEEEVFDVAEMTGRSSYETMLDVLNDWEAVQFLLNEVAAKAGISPERMKSLVEAPQTGDDYYVIPAAVLDEQKVFQYETSPNERAVVTAFVDNPVGRLLQDPRGYLAYGKGS
jgi:hypothetical protein